MSMLEYAMTYIVYWPDAGVLKVGRAWSYRRLDMFAVSGGQVIVLARNTDASWEREALRVLRRWFPQAFANEVEAEELLFLGRGWTECFKVSEHHLQLAVDLCFEGFAEGNEQGVNEATDDQRSGSRVHGVPAGAGRGEADSGGLVDVHGRGWAPGVGSGADRGGVVPGSGGDTDDRGASVDARGVGVSDDLSGGRFGVDRVNATAEDGSPRNHVGVPAAARTRTSTDFHGFGGRAGAGAGADACRGGRAGWAVGRVGARAGATPYAGTPDALGCSTSRMPGSPSQHRGRLRTLRNVSQASRHVGGREQVLGQTHPLPRFPTSDRRRRTVLMRGAVP